MIGHPRGRALGAWFDGEIAEPAGQRITAHVAACERCQARVADLRRIGGALRGEPMPARPARVRRPLPVLSAVLAAALLGFVAGNRSTPSITGGQPASSAKQVSAARAAAPPASHGSAAASADAPAGSRVAEPTAHRSEPSAPAAAASPPLPHRLRLGVMLPPADRAGPAADWPPAADAADALKAAKAAADAANLSGGVGGEPVEIVPLTAGSPVTDVDALVGGWGAATPGQTWVLPADPAFTGSNVIAAEVSAAAAGKALAAASGSRLHGGAIGVVIGDGPEATFSEGLAAGAPTITAEPSRDGLCDEAVARLRSKGARALAVAGTPPLALACADAALRLGWAPPGGLLLAPSAVYAGLERHTSVLGARTVLGLPWPSGDSPGARRFRATTHSTSYRAMVTFAATEVAIAAARSGAPLTAAGLNGSWHSDLITLDGGVNRSASVVTAQGSGWF